MELKCRINGKEYKITQGVTFSEEYNETLDSGTIIISQIPKIEDIEPYDDVYIYDKEFNGYGRYELEYKDAIKFEKDQGGFLAIVAEIPNNFIESLFSGDKIVSQKIELMFFQEEEEGVFVDSYSYCFIDKQGDSYYFVIENINFKEEIILNEEKNIWVFKRTDDIYIRNYDDIKVVDFKTELIYSVNKKNTFYKHMLVDSINREELNFDEGLYKYTILLFSETKRLETIQLPNFSITEPLKIDLKKSIYDYMLDIVEMYSPIYKVIDDESKKTWKYKKKYVIDPDLKEVFGNCYSPDFTLNNPNLRDVLSKLMIVKDMIPYVEDDVIKAMDITKRRGDFDVNYNYINYVYSNKSHSNYCNSLKTTYSDALSQEKSCRLTELLSFRNSDQAMLTINNMRLETTYPIYKINKLYMCYYKKIKIQKKNASDTRYKAFLCKQDITPLVKLNSERNVLSEDWSLFNKQEIISVEQLSKFKIATIGYDIGSKFISGWGQKYTSYALFNWFPKNETYIQKIYEHMNKFYPYGIYDYNYLMDNCQIDSDEIINAIGTEGESLLISAFENAFPAGLKGIMFEIEYEPFYNGTIYHSKDETNRDDIVINDNSSSSLTLLELDGIAQKEKINRFGNETFQINARYTNFNQLQPLGSVYNNKKNADNDVIIYSREYSIYDNVINCRYVGAKDYVLKNYFTSVYAKHRPYNLMGYNESVYRSENRKVFLFLSLDKKIKENNNNVLLFKNFHQKEDILGDAIKIDDPIYKILSFFIETKITHKGSFFDDNKINYGFYEFNGRKYASDVNVFTSGNSLCFNLKMYDNVGAGVYIDVNNLEPDFQLFNVKNDVIGSLQEWYLTVDDEKTGFAEKMGFYIGHIERDSYVPDGVINNIDEINGKKTKEVETLNSQIVNDVLIPGTEVETKKMKILTNDSIYKKVFELPKIIVDDEKIKNLIGNEFLIKKDNKELIDMTFQIEPYTNDEKILISPWMCRLSDLNGIFNKIHKDINIFVDDKGQETENSLKIPINFYETTLADYVYVDNIVGSDYYEVYESYPFMVLSIKNENLNATDTNQGSSLEELLHKNNNVVKLSATFSYIRPRVSGKRMINCTDIHRFVYSVEKIINYDKEKGIIETQGVQNVLFHNVFLGTYLRTRESVERKVLEFHKINEEDYPNIEIPSGETWFVFDGRKQKLSFSGTKKKQTYTCDNNKIIDLKDFENESKKITFYEGNSTSFTSFFLGSRTEYYYQNMFVSTDNEPMKKHNIYNQYKTLEDIGLSEMNKGHLVSDVFSFDDDGVIKINLKLFDKKTTKSIQLWYKDEGGAFNFVFGVNVDEEDFEKFTTDEYGEEEYALIIHTSLLTHKDMRVFDDLHNVVGEVKNIANINEEEEYRDKYLQKYVAKED